MKNVLYYTWNIAAIIIGVLLVVWALTEWSQIGFRLESKFYAGNRDGAFFLFASFIGAGLVCYCLFNLFPNWKHSRLTQYAIQGTKQIKTFMCPKCTTPFSEFDITDQKCPLCNSEVEELDGFYEKHPELRDKA